MLILCYIYRMLSVQNFSKLLDVLPKRAFSPWVGQFAPHIQTISKISLNSLLATTTRSLFSAAISVTVLKKSKLLTFIHEKVGHIWLGCYLTTNYNVPNAILPSYKVFGRNDPESAYSHGIANCGNGEPNFIGKFLGEKGTDAWIAITGSIPQLLLDTALFVGGISIFPYFPGLGVYLTAFGIENSFSNSYVAFDAITCNKDQLIDSRKIGHDFAAFALDIHEITGMPPQLIAAATAIGMFVLFPLGVLFFTLRQK